MSFSTDLQAWSSHKALLGLHDFEIILYEGIKRFLSNRIRTDLEYAKNLIFLTDNAQKLPISEFSTPFCKVWSNILYQINGLAGIITKNCTNINDTCIPKLEDLIIIKKTSMKLFDGQRNKFNTELQRLEDGVKKNHDYYKKKLQKFNNLKGKMDMPKKVQSFSKSGELWGKMMGTSLKIHSAHNAYLLSLREYNAFQKHHNSVLLPGLLDSQQELMEASLLRCQEILAEFTSLTDYSGLDFRLAHERIVKLVESVNPSLEYAAFVTTYRSDPLIFSKKEFDPSLSDSFLGISERTDLIVDESTSNELKKIEVTMAERLLVIKQNLTQKNRELQSLEVERSSTKCDWSFNLNLKNLKREVHELQCFEENYNSLVLSLSEAVKSPGLQRIVGVYNIIEDESEVNPTGSIEMCASIQPPSPNRIGKKSVKAKLEKLFQSASKKNETRAVPGYEDSENLRVPTRVDRNRSSSLRGGQGEQEDMAIYLMDDSSDSNFRSKNRSSSETKLFEGGGDPRRSDHSASRPKRNSIFQLKARGQRMRDESLRTFGRSRRSSSCTSDEDEYNISSTSSSDSLKLKLASKPPPPLPPAKIRFPKSTPKLEDAALINEEWFHGLLPREEVVEMLQNEGEFLVRTTRNKAAPGSGFGSQRQEQFVLSVCCKVGHKHFIIQESEDGFHFEDECFGSVGELIRHYVRSGLHVTERSQVVIRCPVPRQPWELRNEDVKLQEKIGSGQFGEVYRGILSVKSQQLSTIVRSFAPKNSKDSKPVVPPKPSAAAKTPPRSQTPPQKTPPSLPASQQQQLPASAASSELTVAVKICKDSMDDENRARFLKEAKILRLYKHTNVVGFLGVATLSAPVMIVMEFVEGGSLLNFVRKNSLPQSVLLSMCIDVASGMAYLESMKCIHRDLAARNCLVSLSKETTTRDENQQQQQQEQQQQQQYTIKISDFGMSKVENEYVITTGTRQIPIKWTSPEALTFGKYTTASDVWSFGVVIWEIFSGGRVPYQGMSNAVASELVEKGHRLAEIDGMPPKLYELLLKCWYKSPEDRPNFEQILRVLHEIKSHVD